MFHYIVLLTIALSLAGGALAEKRAGRPLTASAYRRNYLIVKDNDEENAYIKREFAEAAKLAVASNQKLDIAVVAAKIAEETPRVARLAKSAAISSAVNSARLALRANAKLASAVKAKNLAQMSGEELDQDGEIRKALSVVAGESVLNTDLTNMVDSENQLKTDENEHIDECSNALRKAVSATRLAHMSNAELVESVSITDQVAARRNAGEVVDNANGAVATYNAAKLVIKSKADLSSAVNERGCVTSALRFDY